MKLLHISDLHLGKRVYEFSMLEDQKYILDQILKIAKDERADGMIIAGDIYDKSVPSAEAVQVFDKFLTRLAEAGIRVFAVSGNHDSAERIAFGAQLMSGRGVYLSPVYDGKIDKIILKDECGEVFLYLLPFIKPAAVRHVLDSERSQRGNLSVQRDDMLRQELFEREKQESPQPGLGDMEEKQEEILTKQVDNLPRQGRGLTGQVNELENREERLTGQVNEFGKQETEPLRLPENYQEAVEAAVKRMNVDISKRNVLVAHQFVTGAGRCESEDVVVGGLDNVDAEVFEAFDYVALGHIHSPQWVGRETVRYCGTPLKYSFSEAEQEKSVTVVELGEKGSVEMHTVPLIPLHDMRKVRGTYMEVTAKDFYQGTNVEDYVQITLTDEEDIPDGLQRLRKFYPNLMRLEYDNNRTRQSQNVEAVKDMEQKSELELFGEFYELQNNQPMTEEQADFIRCLLEEM